MMNVDEIQSCADQGSDGLDQGRVCLGQHGEWYAVRNHRCWRPPTDVYETDDNVVIKVEVAGMRQEDLRVSYRDRRLTIAGCRKDPGGKIIYQNMEIRYGEFRTEVVVGWTVDEGAIRADYEDGFLYVLLPRENSTRHVPIKTADSE